MRTKILLFVLLTSFGMAQAQDTIRSLIISEACLRNNVWAYVELTNMGDEDVQLADFKLGRIDPWEAEVNLTGVGWEPRHADHIMWLPEKTLAPGESFLIASVFDYSLELHDKGIDTPGSGSAEAIHNEEIAAMADMHIHQGEGGENSTLATDSVSPWQTLTVWWARDTWYVQQHFDNGDSLVVDQVNGVFDGGDGLNQKFNNAEEAGYDVAGVARASFTAYLIRRYAVKEGNLNFADARGVGLDDSEWIAIPIQAGGTYDMDFRAAQWTVGNHVDAQLTENTLESDVIEVDFANRTLTVPWGVRRNDYIMNYFEKKPGIGWNYHQAAGTSVDDSLSFAAKSGDQLELFVCGDVLDRAVFEIIVEEPTADANVVVPKLNRDPEGNWRNELTAGMITWPRVTQHESGTDTIWGEWGGIPYQTRIDSLLDRLEIPSNATWELVTVDGVARPDVKEGDFLRIIAEDGSQKDYYLAVNEIRPSHNADLSAITWPDIPDFYKGIFGWVGDTIPNFGSGTNNYTVTVPLDVEGIPAIVAKKEDLNATVDVNRATNLSGTKENRTVSFTVTAEDDTTVNTYNVELKKEKNPEDVQPFAPDPFISEKITKKQWANSYLEVCNPGNQIMDLSNYMFVSSLAEENPAVQVESTEFGTRYRKYIPGYKWSDSEAEWATNPGILQTDLSVNTYVEPGDVFVMADIPKPKGHTPWDQVDVDFVTQWGDVGANNQNGAIGHWQNSFLFVFKILNDSIKQGLKPATDVNDFELIDAMPWWKLSGSYANTTLRRKPEVWHGDPILGSSTDEENPENFEWIKLHRTQNLGGGWDAVVANIGQHHFIPPTHYMSTVSSVVYKVSDGYSMSESIWGMKTGTTVAEFIDNIIKNDTNQTLNVHSVEDGSVLGADATLSMNDTLVVLSADSVNTTKYILEVTEAGLSSDALLTSNRYEITVDSEPKSADAIVEDGTGTITGFEYGTQLKVLLDNIDVPAGATLSVIDGEGAYVPLTTLNFDTTYVFSTVNANTYFDVLAEDGVTKIVYQLQPQATPADAIVLSDIYNVDQRNLLIEFVPRGTNVQPFLSNLVPSFGATMKVFDKMGNERTDGTVADDDKLVVTSADGTTTNVYFISKLATEYVPETKYLAYITSNVYGVDQINYEVQNVSGDASISEFYSRIDVAEGATAVVVDENGVEKTTGDIDRTDMVKVISADGKVTVMYSFATLVSANSLAKSDINIYPNPTKGKLNISGAEPGSRIRIFNSMGKMINNIEVKQSVETVSLEGFASGVYFVITSNENAITGKQKVVKF